MNTISSKNWLILLFFFPLFFAVNYQGGDFYWIAPASVAVVMMLGIGLWGRLDKSVYFPHCLSWKLLWAFLLWSCLTIFWSVSAYQSLLQSFLLLLAGLMGLIYFLLFNNNKSWQLVWISTLILGLTLCLLQLIQNWNGIVRPSSLFLNPNTFAAFLNLLILPTVGYYFLTETKTSRYYLAVLFVLLSSFFLTGSRGALVGQLTGFGVFFFLFHSRLNKAKVTKFVFVYVAVLLSISVLNDQYFRPDSNEISSLDNGRKIIWGASINLLHNTPWYGNGLGTYWLSYPRYRAPNDPSVGQNAHNDYLQFAIETGYPGIALFLLFAVSFFLAGYKLLSRGLIKLDNQQEAGGILAGLISIGVHSLFTFNLGVYAILFLTGILLGRFYALTGQVKEVLNFSILGARKNIVKSLIVVGSIFLSAIFIILSMYAYYINNAQKYYSEGKIEKADINNAKAIAINPYDDRSYLLYVEMYTDVLEKIPELDTAKKQYYFDSALSYLRKARDLNPYRDVNYYLNAQLLEIKPKELGAVRDEEIIKLYLEALKTNRKSLLAVEGLYEFYMKINNPVEAKNLIMNTISWRFHDIYRANKFFRSVEPIVKEFASPSEQQAFNEKKLKIEVRYSELQSVKK